MGEEGELTNYRIYGMSFAYTFVQALEAAGEDLTRDGLVEAIEDQGGDFAGPQLAPYRYSPTATSASRGCRSSSCRTASGTRYPRAHDRHR